MQPIELLYLADNLVRFRQTFYHLHALLSSSDRVLALSKQIV